MIARVVHDPRVRRLWPWAPLLLAAVWAVAVALDLRSLVQAIYSNADFVSGPVIGELYDERAPGTQVVLGNFPWYETLWFELATADLPAHRQIWQLGPWLFSLLGVAAVAWATWRAAGAWAAMIVAVVLGCAGPGLLAFQFGGTLHGPAFAHVCLLGAFLVLCAAHGGRVGPWPVHVALCALLAAVTAIGLASDKLLVPAGIAPFALGALAMAWLLPRAVGLRVAVSALAVSAVSALGARWLIARMQDENVVASQFEIVFTTWDRVFSNGRILVNSLAFMFNGDPGGARIEVWSVLSLACAAVLVVAVVYAVRRSREWIASVLRGPAEDRDEWPRRAHLAFWILAGASLAATFVLSSVPVDKYSARYVLSVGYAVVVVAAVMAARSPRARAAVVVGASLVVLNGITGVLRNALQDAARAYPGGHVSGPLERLGREERVEHGYAGYWTAAPLTWQTRMRVKVYPVKSCTGGPTVCPFPFHKIGSWYEPRPGARTMFIVDPLQPAAGAPTGTDPAFGRPERVVRLSQMTVYIYGYDIAARFGR